MTGSERRPPACPNTWWKPGEREPEEPEVLFFALAVMASADKPGELRKWAHEVIKLTSDAERDREWWSAPTTAPWAVDNRTSTIFTPLKVAFQDVSWTDDALGAICKAMQAWDGKGQTDGLNAGHLKTYIHLKKPRAVRAVKKTKPPFRWRSWAVVKVAKLIWDHGRRFRELLGLDVEATPVLTSWERIAAAKAETATAKAAKVKAEAAEVAMKAERDRVQNAHRLSDRMQQQRLRFSTPMTP